MLWNHRQLKHEIALQHQRIIDARAAFAANTDAAQQALRQRTVAPRTLGIVFVAGLVYGLIGQRRLLPSGLSWLFWHTGSSLLLRFLTKSFGENGTAAKP
jgi:hypothetical protein